MDAKTFLRNHGLETLIPVIVERNKVTVFINTVAYDLQPYPSNGQQPMQQG
jgi:hypothetical protein